MFVGNETTNKMWVRSVASPLYVQMFLWLFHLILPPWCTDPARPGEEQPDTAFLSETSFAAAPGPGDQHGRAGSNHTYVYLCVFSVAVYHSTVCCVGLS